MWSVKSFQLQAHAKGITIDLTLNRVGWCWVSTTSYYYNLYFSHIVVSEVQLRDKNNDVIFRTGSFTVTQDPDIETSKVSMSPWAYIV